VDWSRFDHRRLSCGIVVVNDSAELLLCHVTGHDHWDLPKGGLRSGESPLQGAVRETYEETGLRFEAPALLELGRFAYSARKDLHLFAARHPRIDPAELFCVSRFVDRATGRELPEMDGFGWFAFEAVAARCKPKLASVLLSQIDLPRLLGRLQRPAALAA
jgi:8-oxo-dGTP pyrophosphatase MutT (NUDIX family)